MAETIPLVDTNVLIEVMRRNKPLRRRFDELKTFFYSIVTKKELLGKKGLKTTEAEAIENILAGGKVFFIDTSILEGIRILTPLYRKKNIRDQNDIIIAATALIKNLPLWTLNRKHFSFIKGLKLIS